MISKFFMAIVVVVYHVAIVAIEGGLVKESVTFRLIHFRLVRFRLVHFRLAQVRLCNISPNLHFA